MQIKRFTAPNMPDALQQVKSELGTDAVILSARTLKRGNAVWRPFRRSAVEVTAAIDHRLPQPAHSVEAAMPAACSPAAGARSGRRGAALKTYARSAAIGRENTGAVPPAGGRPPAAAGESAPLERRLMRHQVKKAHAVPIASGFGDSERQSGDVDKLTRALKSAGFSAATLAPRPGQQKIVALIGPPGVGKTTTAAKLAAHFALEAALSVACLSIDHIRIAGSEQLEIIADILGVPFAAAGHRRDIKPAMKRLESCDLVLIDTPALHRRPSAAREQLFALLEKIPAVEKHLLVDATSSEEVQADLVERAAGLDIERVIFTKVDESPVLGHLINLAIDHRLSVAGLTTGSRIPEDLELSPPAYLAGQLLSPGEDGQKDGRPSRRQPGPARRIFRVAEEKKPQPFFVANRTSDVFHTPECKWTKMIKEDHIVVFADTTEARQKRYKPCRYCCPPQDGHRAQVTAGPSVPAVGQH